MLQDSHYLLGLKPFLTTSNRGFFSAKHQNTMSMTPGCPIFFSLRWDDESRWDFFRPQRPLHCKYSNLNGENERHFRNFCSCSRTSSSLDSRRACAVICSNVTAQESAISKGRVVIPENAIEHPGDVGVRAHQPL